MCESMKWLQMLHGMVCENSLGMDSVGIPWNSDLSRLGQVRLLGPVSGLTQTKGRVQTRTVVGPRTDLRRSRRLHYRRGVGALDALA